MKAIKRPLVGNEIELLLDELNTKPRKTPMTPSNTELFMKLCLNPGLEKDLRFNEEGKDQLRSSGEGILIHRMRVLGYELKPYTAIAIGCLIEDPSPGVFVMYAYYCAYMCKKKGIKEMTFKNFADWFPLGGFSKSDLDKFWNSQKDLNSPCSNLIDDILASDSIMCKY